MAASHQGCEEAVWGNASALDPLLMQSWMATLTQRQIAAVGIMPSRQALTSINEKET